MWKEKGSSECSFYTALFHVGAFLRKDIYVGSEQAFGTTAPESQGCKPGEHHELGKNLGRDLGQWQLPEEWGWLGLGAVSGGRQSKGSHVLTLGVGVSLSDFSI